ncbi:MAG: pirin-like C-terminal cupin domain-containing protein, partial [Bacilli bacterium]
DVHLQANQTFGLDVDAKRSIMLFTLVGEIMLNDQVIKEKTAVKLSAGDRVEFSSLDRPVQVLYISSCALNESVAWGGPIVMNTKEELYQAFDELEKETFLRDKIAY